jgi:hypothetical protein
VEKRRASIMMDNLIASGDAEPKLVVVDLGYAECSPTIPLIEPNRASGRRE